MLSLVLVSNKWPLQRIAAILASIALASMVNTFCHLHTPLVISALRVGYGVVFGLLAAVVITRIVEKTGLLKHEETASA
jgi:NhaP-type Na+/H+ and K+/H+ antiporter